MKASTFIGLNAGQLDFNIFATARFHGRTRQDLMVNQLFTQMSSIDFIYGSVEGDQFNKHAHIIGLANDDFDDELKEVVKPTRIIQANRRVLVKFPNKKMPSGFRDKWIDEKAEILKFGMGEIWIVKNFSKENAAYYIAKFCDYGANTFYYKKES